MWGQSTAIKVLFDSLIAEKSDGTVIIGRGVPNEWIRNRQQIALNSYPVTGGRIGYQLTTSGRTVTLRLSGDTAKPTGYSIELPVLRDNIAHVSTGGAVVDQVTGTVRLPRGTTQATVVLRRAP
jgi:hypothetical protein